MSISGLSGCAGVGISVFTGALTQCFKVIADVDNAPRKCVRLPGDDTLDKGDCS